MSIYIEDYYYLTPARVIHADIRIVDMSDGNELIGTMTIDSTDVYYEQAKTIADLKSKKVQIERMNKLLLSQTTQVDELIDQLKVATQA